MIIKLFWWNENVQISGVRGGDATSAAISVGKGGNAYGIYWKKGNLSVKNVVSSSLSSPSYLFFFSCLLFLSCRDLF